MIKTEQKNAIIIFTRYPESGKVKTRLADSIGDESACRLHKILAERIFNECLLLDEKDFSLFVFYPEENNTEQVRNWVNKRFTLFTQIGKTLGEKMSNAFNKIFELNFEKTIIIGTDIPDISKSILSEAFLDLEKNDIVIGPSNDGGYYLLGMNKFIPEMFENIEWSIGPVFRKTTENINQNKLRYRTMEMLIDIDVKEDLLNWHEKNKVKCNDELVKYISRLIF